MSVDVPSSLPVKVLKFGGTSVGTATRLRTVARLIEEASVEHRPVVVASAASGVTDHLVASLGLQAPIPPGELSAFLRTRYLTLATALLEPEGRAGYREVVDRRLAQIRARLELRAAVGPCPDQEAEVLASGERLSVPLIAALLKQRGVAAQPVDAAALIRTDRSFKDADVDLRFTLDRIRTWYETWPKDVIPVVTGYIGSTPEGHTTVLGRGGSDYTAAILARALRASVFERWTDTDGLYTNDPRRDPKAKYLSHLAFEQALPFNRAGKLGMHQQALDPLRSTSIPVHVRSTLAPDRPGTIILPARQAG